MTRWLIGVLILLGVVSCGFFDATEVEIARFPSPSGLIEAVVFERGAGATTPSVFDVYAVSHGLTSDAVRPDSKVASVCNPRGAGGSLGLGVRWKSENEVEVLFDDAKWATDGHASVGGTVISATLRGTADQLQTNNR